jgi:prepilin-type N-terminal cleavage/methylation domain-containing protein
MFKMVRNKKGFTLIELMIVVAIVGILAAIAIPAYIDYTIRARITEIAGGYDALSTSLSEYHASNGFFPRNVPTDTLASLPTNYGQYLWDSGGGSTASGGVPDSVNYKFEIGIAPYKSIGTAVDKCYLNMTLNYAKDAGYKKFWSGDLAAKYKPKQ